MVGILSLCLSLSVHLLSFQFVTVSSAQPIFMRHKCDNSYGNYTSSSTYRENLDTLLSNVCSSRSKAQITSGFYNFSAGTDPDIVNGIGMCRGDVSKDECRGCLKFSATNLYNLCTNQKQAIIWYDNCMFRYTNRSISGVMELYPRFWIRNRYKVLDPNDYARVLFDLFGRLLKKAESGNSTLKYAIGQANVSTSLTMHMHNALRICLRQIVGARYSRASCNIRYEAFNFANVYSTLAFATPSPLEAPTPRRGKRSTSVIVGVIATVVSLLLVTSICFCLRQQRRKGKKDNNELGLQDEITSSETLQFSYGDIKDATDNFATTNKLGKGGFGTVYKGVLANKQEIAVKRLSSNSTQGEVEFRNEVLLVAKLQHRNLVRLLGFSMAGDERLLIYEFVPNANLDHFMFGKNRHGSLDWHTRYNIIGGIARGLVYLHEYSRLRIIHRDLKASNILLDAHLNPKIADFGKARLFQADQTHADTDKISGTFGYMAPEYVYRGVFSIKSDVCSFGILVLEIICGQKISRIQKDDNMEDLNASVLRNWTEGTTSEVIDSTLQSASTTEIMRCIHISLLCIQANPVNRPTMSSVIQMLTSESLSLPVPSRPAYVPQRSLATDPQSLASVENESITELHPR